MVSGDLPGLREVGIVDWDYVEADIGYSAPRDYKNLIDAIGAGVIDDSLCIYGVDRIDRDGNLLELVRLCDDAWEDYRTAGVVLPERYFSGVRLIPFGSAEGNYFYWIATESVSADDWNVVFVDVDLQNWYEYDLMATEFIRRLLTAEIEPPTLAGIFGLKHHKMERFGDEPVDSAS